MFHALRERFQLELFILLPIFSPLFHSQVVLFPVGLSSLTRHFEQVLQFLLSPSLATVNCPSQEIEETTRPVENVALTTKGLQERKHNL